MNDALAEGRELLDLVEMLGELEWAKFESRRPSIAAQGVLTAEDRSAHPPYTSFRFRHEEPEMTKKLAEAIDSYTGELRWVMVAHDRAPLPGVNWTICPKLVEDSRAEATSLRLPTWTYFKEQRPAFGPVAYKDMLGLAKHLKERLGLQGAA